MFLVPYCVPISIERGSPPSFKKRLPDTGTYTITVDAGTAVSKRIFTGFRGPSRY